MSEYNITWSKRNNEELEYEIEELKIEIRELEKRNLKLMHENIMWEILYIVSIMMNLMIVIFK